MVFFSLAFFAVTFLVTALLAPKPELEDARAQELDPANFPRATEDDPIPLLLGCARIKGPNTLWYGNYQSIPIREKVKTGLFSSSRVTVGYIYRLSIDLGLCLGPAELKQIYIDSEPVEPGIQPAITEDFEFFSEISDGVEDSRPGFTTATTVPFDVEFSATTLDLNPTVYNNADLGLLDGNVDGGALTFVATYDLVCGSVFGGSITGAITIQFFDGPNATGNQLGLDIGEQEVATAPAGQFGDTVNLEATALMPAGTRSVRISAGCAIVVPASENGTAFNHRVAVNGPNILYAEQAFDIFEPELYGGRKSGGGHVGNARFYPGTFTQAADPHVALIVGGTVPAYRGTAHIVLEDNEIGESPQLRRMEFLMGALVDEFTLGFLGRAFDGSVDISPAEALNHVMKDRWRGLSTLPAKINNASFLAAGQTLVTEQHGLSLVVSSSQQGKVTMREILRQIDGVLAENQDGEAVLKLIRDDYDPNTLPIYDEDDILEITSYSRTAWADVVSEVKVSFSDRDQESSRVAVDQDAATLNMIGTRRTSQISFPFCYDENLAARLAARELNRLSKPLARFTAIMNRSAFQFAVGDVVKVSWAEYGLSELIVRVQRVNLGSLEDNSIRVEFIQDVFAAGTALFLPPAGSSWVNGRPNPVDIVTSEIVEQPYFLASRLDSPALDGFGALIPFALRPQTGSSGLTFNADVVGGGELGYFDPTEAAYPVTGQFVGAYAQYAGFETGTDAAGFVIDGVDGTLLTNTQGDIKAGTQGLIYANGEWMGYEGVTDNLDGTFTLTNVHRALMGTQPVLHADDSRVWVLDSELLGLGDLPGELEETDTCFYKLLDRVGAVQRSPAAVTEQSFALQDIADRPLRPRNLTIDGSRSEVPYIYGGGTIEVNGVSSNRLAAEIAFETDATEVPDIAETYDLQVWLDGVQQGALDQSGTFPFTVDLSSLTGAGGEIRVFSRRTSGDLKSSVYYAVYPFTLQITMDTTGTSMDSTNVTMDRT